MLRELFFKIFGKKSLAGIQKRKANALGIFQQTKNELDKIIADVKVAMIADQKAIEQLEAQILSKRDNIKSLVEEDALMNETVEKINELIGTKKLHK